MVIDEALRNGMYFMGSSFRNRMHRLTGITDIKKKNTLQIKFFLSKNIWLHKPHLSEYVVALDKGHL